jgi:amino acid permease
MVFAFSHTPIISTFAIDRREKYGEQAMGKCKKIMKVAYLVICLSVLFFVFSCSLDSAVIYYYRKEEGVTILSALSMMPNSLRAGCPFPVLLWQSWQCQNRSSAPILA